MARPSPVRSPAAGAAGESGGVLPGCLLPAPLREKKTNYYLINRLPGVCHLC